MFRNKKVNFVVSVLLAIILWAYVVGQVNPATKQTYKHIPVSIINQNVLWNQDLALEDPGVLYVDVTISGTRSAVKEAVKSDIKVTADVSALTKGENTVALKVRVPGNISVSGMSKETVKLDVSSIVSEEKEVRAKFFGTDSGNSEPGDVSTDPSSVTVSGTQSQVDSVSYIAAAVSTAKINETETTVSAALSPVDKTGAAVRFVRMSDSTANVTASMKSVKEVALKVNITGSLPQGYMLSSKEVPDKIKIKGSASDLAGISSVTAADISLSDIRSSTTVPLDIDLPYGVYRADQGGMPSAKIVLQAMRTASFDFSESDITVEDVASGLTADQDPIKVKVTVTAAEKLISGITAEDIVLSAGCGGLGEGRHDVQIKVSCAKAASTAASPKTTSVTLSK